MRGKHDKYTTGERAIIMLGKLAGKSLDEVNAALEADAERNGGDYKPCPEGSWRTMKQYGDDVGVTSIDQATWERMWGHVRGPKRLKDLGINRARIRRVR